MYALQRTGNLLNCDQALTKTAYAILRGTIHGQSKEEHLDTKRMLREVEAEIKKLESIADVLRGSKSKQTRGKRKTMSAAARKKISLAQKARWAKQKSKSS